PYPQFILLTINFFNKCINIIIYVKLQNQTIGKSSIHADVNAARNIIDIQTNKPSAVSGQNA
ncbi:MAG: hypothetical protein ACFFEA_14275, partial [Candidatus Thorarchaeota archaeon]